jgi:hypothetical protein
MSGAKEGEMRYPTAALALLLISANAFAATTAGTIISTYANATYADSSGQSMPEENSNKTNVLVTPATAQNPVMLTVRALFQGPSTIGRLVKVVGRVYTDANGVWIDDGSTIANTSDTEEPVACRIATTFLGQAPAAGGFIAVTGYSQKDASGTPVIVPDADIQLQNFFP